MVPESERAIPSDFCVLCVLLRQNPLHQTFSIGRKGSQRAQRDARREHGDASQESLKQPEGSSQAHLFSSRLHAPSSNPWPAGTSDAAKAMTDMPLQWSSSVTLGLRSSSSEVGSCKKSFFFEQEETEVCGKGGSFAPTFRDIHKDSKPRITRMVTDSRCRAEAAFQSHSPSVQIREI